MYTVRYIVRALVAVGVNPHVVWLEPRPPDRGRQGDLPGPTDADAMPELRQWRRRNGMREDIPSLVRGSAPPACTPLALALRESRSVGALTSIILTLDSAVPISTPAEIAEDEARWAKAAAARLSYQSSESARGSATTRKLRRAGFGWVYPEASTAADELAAYWSAGQATLLDELLSCVVRDQSLSALEQVLRSGWYCTQLQARRTLAAVFEGIFLNNTDWHRAVLEQLLTDNGQCGEVFRWALSPLQLISESDDDVAPYGPSRRPLAFALEHHEFRLIKVLLKAGAVLLPCDDEALSAMAARTDVCTCTDTAICDELLGRRCGGQKRRRGEVLASCLALRDTQQLVMARQRLSFALAFHRRLEGVQLRGSSSKLCVSVRPEGVVINAPDSIIAPDSYVAADCDVVDRVGEQMLTASVRPGWLGREASRILTSRYG